MFWSTISLASLAHVVVDGRSAVRLIGIAFGLRNLPDGVAARDEGGKRGADLSPVPNFSEVVLQAEAAALRSGGLTQRITAEGQSVA